MKKGGLFRLCAALALCAACASAATARQSSGEGVPAAEPSPAPPAGQSSLPPPARPAYKLLRHEEDWGALRDPALRVEALDRIKYIPLREKEGWHLSLGGEARVRFARLGNPSWGQEPGGDDGFLLQRYMLHADLRLGARVRLFGQIESGLERGRKGGPGPADEDRLDLHQAFADLKLDAGKGRTLTLRAGRQELAFGSSRLVGVRDSPNVRRSFDGVRATLGAGGWRIDGFVTKPAETKPGLFDDAPDHALTFWGAYAARPWKFLPGGNVDLYYLGIDRKHARFDQGAAREVRHSAGTRLWGGRAGWDYNYEFVYQWGSFGRGRIRAWTAASDGGYTFSRARFAPRVGLRADVTSGDRDPADPDLQTFNPLFPRGAYFGEIALIGPSNHIDLHPSLELKVLESLTVTADSVFFWRQSLRDGIYGNAVNLLREGGAGRARFVGSQPSLGAEWQVNRHVTWAAAFSYFFAGPFLKEPGPGRDVSYATSWVTYKF